MNLDKGEKDRKRKERERNNKGRELSGKSKESTTFFLLSLPSFSCAPECFRNRKLTEVHQAHLLRSVSDDRNKEALLLLLLARQGRGRGRGAAVGIFALSGGILLSERGPDEQFRADLPESRRSEVDAHFLRALPDRRREDEVRDLGTWLNNIFLLYYCFFFEGVEVRGALSKEMKEYSALSFSLSQP